MRFIGFRKGIAAAAADGDRRGFYFGAELLGRRERRRRPTRPVLERWERNALGARFASDYEVWNTSPGE